MPWIIRFGAAAVRFAATPDNRADRTLTKIAERRDLTKNTGAPDFQFLQGIAKPGAPILGIGNCSRAYAPNPLQFQCVTCLPGGCKQEDLTETIERVRPLYLIVEEEGTAKSRIKDLDQDYRIYQDAFYSVYKTGNGPLRPAK